MTHGPGDPDEIDEYLRDVMGVTDEGMRELEAVARRRHEREAKEAAVAQKVKGKPNPRR